MASPRVEMTEEQKKTLEMLLPSYDAGDDLIVPRGRLPEQLLLEVQSSDDVKFLLAGQRGMGKTTELRRLIRLLEQTDQLPVFVQFGSQERISHDMLLSAMATGLLSSIPGRPSKRLEKAHDNFCQWYAEEEEVEVRAQTNHGEAALGGKIPILEARRGVSHSKEKKTMTRMKKDRLLRDLLDSFNRLVQEAHSHTGKRPVFVVDDIDKIQNVNSIQDTFIHASDLVSQISAPCIFTVPITYATSSLVRMGSLPYGGIHRVPAVELVDATGQRNEQAYRFLKRVFELRMPFNPIKDEKVLDKLLSFSGGVLVDAMRMARGICKRAILDGPVGVTEKTIEEEFQHLVDDYQFVLDSLDIWRRVADVCRANDTRKIMTDELLPELLYKMIVIEYRQTKLRFDLHPGVRRLYEQNSDVINKALGIL